MIRLNIQDTVGQIFGRKYRFEFTPTFILFDGLGDEVWRSVGMINSNDVRQFMRDL